MEILLIILSVLVAAAIVLLVVLLAKTSRKAKPDEAEKFLQNDLANLRRDVGELSQNLTKNLRDNSELLRDKLDQKLDATQKGMTKQMEDSREIVAKITASLTQLKDTNERVISTQDELKTLQNVLIGAKTRGNLGEYYLEDILGNVLPPTVWVRQFHFKNGEAVDAIVKLKDGKILPIDSKFSLENYNRMVEAKSRETRDKFRDELKRDLKNRIDETAKYIRPRENTMDFAFMFIPSEALYYDAIIGDVGSGGSSRNLIDYAFNEKKVIIVSPTTLLAYLQTVMQGLRSLQIEEQAKEIQARVGQLKQHLAKYEEYHTNLGRSLATTVNRFNDADKEFAKIDKDVVKIAGGESSVEPLQIDKPRED